MSLPSLRRADFQAQKERILQCIESLASSTAMTAKEMAIHIKGEFGVTMLEQDIRNQLGKLLRQPPFLVQI